MEGSNQQPASVSQQKNASPSDAYVNALDKLMASMIQEKGEFSNTIEEIVADAVKSEVEDATSDQMDEDAVSSLIDNKMEDFPDEDRVDEIVNNVIDNYDFSSIVEDNAPEIDINDYESEIEDVVDNVLENHEFVERSEMQKLVDDAVKVAHPLSDEKVAEITKNVSKAVVEAIGKAIAEAFTKMG